MITTHYLYNIIPKSNNILDKLKSSFMRKIKRKIDIKKLIGITVSTISNEFAIHVN